MTFNFEDSTRNVSSGPRLWNEGNMPSSHDSAFDTQPSQDPPEINQGYSKTEDRKILGPSNFKTLECFHKERRNATSSIQKGKHVPQINYSAGSYKDQFGTLFDNENSISTSSSQSRKEGSQAEMSFDGENTAFKSKTPSKKSSHSLVKYFPQRSNRIKIHSTVNYSQQEKRERQKAQEKYYSPNTKVEDSLNKNTRGWTRKLISLITLKSSNLKQPNPLSVIANVNPALKPLITKPLAREEKLVMNSPSLRVSKSRLNAVNPEDPGREDFGQYMRSYAESKFARISEQADVIIKQDDKDISSPLYAQSLLKDLNVADNIDTFRRILVHAMKKFEVDCCLISYLDKHMQYIRCDLGLSAQADRQISFCGQSAGRMEPTIVLDAQKDRRMMNNPLVTGSPNIRFYAGIPIISPAGYVIGTFSLLDRQEKSDFDKKDCLKLGELANAIFIETVRCQSVARQIQGVVKSASYKIESDIGEVTIDYGRNEESIFTTTAAAEKVDSQMMIQGLGRKASDETSLEKSKEYLTTVDKTKHDDRECRKREETSRPEIGEATSIDLFPNDARIFSEIVSKQQKAKAKYDSLKSIELACGMIAQTLNLDFVYILKVINMGKSENNENCVNLLGSFGNLHHKPPYFDVALHQRALKSTSGYIYRNSNNSGDDDNKVKSDAFAIGILMPLWKMEPECLNGAVLGGYAKSIRGRKGKVVMETAFKSILTIGVFFYLFFFFF